MIDLIGAISLIWIVISVFVGYNYLVKRDSIFEEDHIYVADIIIGLICLPLTIFIGLFFLINKLIHIKIK